MDALEKREALELSRQMRISELEQELEDSLHSRLHLLVIFTGRKVEIIDSFISLSGNRVNILGPFQTHPTPR